MKYGNVNLKYQLGSLSINIRKAQEVRHYPGTDNADVIDIGRPPTRISCTLIAESETELINIQQLLHTISENELQFDGFYYKRVVSAQQGTPKPQTSDENIWFIDAEFVALDPLPYDIDTDEVLY
jgi:hypothetical protein